LYTGRPCEVLAEVLAFGSTPSSGHGPGHVTSLNLGNNQYLRNGAR